ncbi:MAG: universal stress protein [Microlunatus sp.]|nr:universal stress protein [Microlunatus sp.]MDN5771465.1 universal stress protein [Microlunatus sp.]
METWRRVVVGVDGSEGSGRALRWAASEARAHGAELKVVTTYPAPSPRLATEFGSAPWLERTDWRGKAEAALESTVRDALGENPGVPVELTLAEGSAAKTLIDLSADADMLVVGTRGHGGFAGLLLGSVSQHVVAHARCAVTVVR